MKNKRGFISIILNLIVPGLGLHYLGKTKKGILFFVVNFSIMITECLIYLISPIQYLMIIIILLSVIGFNIILFVTTIKEFNNQFKETFFYRWYTCIAIIFILNILIFPYTIQVINKTLFQTFKIPSFNMKNTILPGERAIANNLIYHFTTPKRGDIVSYKNEGNDPTTYISRIIGIPGDTIEIIESDVLINGDELIEEYKYLKYDSIISNRMFELSPEIVNFNSKKIPTGKYFLLGDNRYNSYDSREKGFVDINKIIGRFEKIYWSKDITRIDTSLNNSE